MTNHYDRVGVSLTATTAEIKRAYRKRARHAHPDRGGSADQFRLLTDAYNTLVSPALRGAYDAELERACRTSGEATQEPPGQEPPGPGASERRPPDSGPGKPGDRSTEQPPSSAHSRQGSGARALPPRAALSEPRFPERPERSERAALILSWVAAALLLLYVAGACLLMLGGRTVPHYGLFVRSVAVPLLVGIGARRRARDRNAPRSTLAWQVAGLVLSAAAAVSVGADLGDGAVTPSGPEPWPIHVFSVGTLLVPAVLTIAGEAVRRTRLRARRQLSAEHVEWARATEQRARAEDWAGMYTTSCRPGHSLWWVTSAERVGAQTRVDATDLNRTDARTITVAGHCLALIWIVVDEHATIVRRCSDDRRQAWTNEAARSSAR